MPRRRAAPRPGAPRPARRPSADPSTPAPTSPSADASPSASATPGKALTRSSLAAEDDPTLHTTINHRPTSPTLDRTDTFTYEADRPNVKFHCTLTGPGLTSTVFDCPLDSPTKDPLKTTGTFTTGALAPSRGAYKLVVQAYQPAVVVDTPDLEGSTASYSWRVFSITRPDNYVPATGATYNKPLGDRSEQRRNLTRMIRTINSMPGYLQATGTDGAPCPSNPALVPGTIRVSMYSMTDGPFANALVAAHRRCLSVKILMNNHLNADTDPGLADRAAKASAGPGHRAGASRDAAGRTGARSAAAAPACMHTKMYLFDSTVPAPARGGTRSRTRPSSARRT